MRKHKKPFENVNSPIRSESQKTIKIIKNYKPDKSEFEITDHLIGNLLLAVKKKSKRCKSVKPKVSTQKSPVRSWGTHKDSISWGEHSHSDKDNNNGVSDQMSLDKLLTKSIPVGKLLNYLLCHSKFDPKMTNILEDLKSMATE